MHALCRHRQQQPGRTRFTMEGKDRQQLDRLSQGDGMQLDNPTRLLWQQGSAHLHLTEGQTDMDIVFSAPKRDVAPVARAALLLSRSEIKHYIKRQPEFETSLVPVTPVAGAPEIVRIMCEAADKVGVGPMAAICGTIAQRVVEAMSPVCEDILVENGGDIYYNLTKERVIAINAGPSPLSGQVGLRVSGRGAICTSSGTQGRGLSFGKTDASIVLGEDGALCDAAATALGNAVQSPQDFALALSTVTKLPGVTGALVIMGEAMATRGEVSVVQL